MTSFGVGRLGNPLRRIRYELARRLGGPALIGIGRLKKRLAAKRTASPPPIECTRKLKELLTSHYLAGRYAAGAVPVAWVTSGFPVEILRPFGFHVVYPENHAALCGVQRLGPELAGVAEEWGQPRDTCGYARCDIGCALGGRSPVGQLPKPDILLACTNICQTVIYWYRTLGRILGVPVCVIDTPYHDGEPTERAEQYIASQIEECIDLCARVSNRRADRSALSHVARVSREGSELWGECLALTRQSPAPWSAFDQFIHLGPIVTLRGLPECNVYYRLLRDELSDRVRRGIAVVPNERHRLLWDNLPVWYEMRSQFNLLAAAGCNIVAATYTYGWAETAHLFDPEDPVRSAARVYGRIFLNRDLGYRLELMSRLARDYACDGALLHSNRSCKPYSVGQLDIARELDARGVRTLVFEADHIDSRAFSKEQTESRLGAFLESFA